MPKEVAKRLTDTDRIDAENGLVVVELRDLVVVVRETERRRPVETAGTATEHVSAQRELDAFVLHAAHVAPQRRVAGLTRYWPRDEQVRRLLIVIINGEPETITDEREVDAQVELVGRLPTELRVGQLERTDSWCTQVIRTATEQAARGEVAQVLLVAGAAVAGT